MMFSILLAILAGRSSSGRFGDRRVTAGLSIFLKDVRRDGGSSGGRRRLRGALVAAQVALALVLLTGAGLAIRSFDRLMRVDPGFQTANVLTFRVNLPDALYPTMASQTRFFRDYTERIRQVPGVTAAGAVSFAPLARSGFGGSFTIYGRPEGADEGNAQVRSMTPGYMEALSIPLKSGRRVTAQDTETAPRVALVSETAARRFWPGQNPVGKQLRVHVNEPTRLPREYRRRASDPRLEIDPSGYYVPHTQSGPESDDVVRSGGDPIPLVAIQGDAFALGRSAISAPGRWDISYRQRREPRFRSAAVRSSRSFAGVAAVGLYGVVAFR